MKKLKEIIDIMEDFAPLNLKEDFDNVGLMVGDKESEVKRVLLALDCTLDVIEEAKEKKVDLIITHHPLLFKKPSSITTDTLTGKKIIELIKNNINLYSSHTNLDSAKEGLNETIVNILGYNSEELIEINKNARNSNEGLGRIIRLEEAISLDEFVDNVKKKLNISNVKLVKASDKVKNIAVINGSGSSFLDIAYRRGADCVITGDTTYHYASDYKEMGVSIIDTGHFHSEWIVFLEVINKIKDKLEDVEILVSENSEDPYTYA
ncbi:Nif3-like dinuclear metal center hexameric protein [Clostridium sartagoforme]|uniref:GTP cyclohydrolase 1 type 2 homolog n=1 Tax=Clostridium sartagoforme TaxID=84031 RepID=A0A4S2DMP4_9CLOT|nr:Nif3-like dinuclear metal center hexameric protein [Clostridium sartagoforme]TGY43335.1 Nif3-like dinuclear metal center hexameric protein [Clostridium sartagoforme]